MMGTLRKGFVEQPGSIGLAAGLFLEHPHAVTGEGLLNLLVEVARIEGLDEKAIGTGLETGCHLLRAGIGAGDEDRNVLCERATAQSADQMKRVDVRERGVQQNEVKGAFIGLAEAFVLAASDHDVASAHPFKNDTDSLEGSGVVVHDQNVAKAVGARCDGHGALGLPTGRRLGGRMGLVDIGARHAGIIA
jgi:hypothetical protein